MRAFRSFYLVVLLCFSTLVLVNAAEVLSDNAEGISPDLLEAPRPISSPWTILHSDGRVRIALEFPASLPAERLVHLHLRRLKTDSFGKTIGVGDALTVRREQKLISRPLSKTTQVVCFILEREQTFHRELVLWLGTDRSYRIRLPRLPHLKEAARVVFVGGRRWPDRTDMNRLEEEIGGPPHVAILVGDGWASQLGKGGWEPQIPLVVPGRRSNDPLFDALVGPPHDWRGGFNFGNLGMPLIQDPLKTALDVASFFNPWVVPLEQTNLWRMDRQAQRDQESLNRLGLVVDAATKRDHLPLVISATSGAGFISDTLYTTDAQNVAVKRGGVRLVNALADGSSVRSLPPEIALSIDRPHLNALIADDQLLQLVSVPMANPQSPVLRMHWEHLTEEVQDQIANKRPFANNGFLGDDRAEVELDNQMSSPFWGLLDGEGLYESWQDRDSFTEDEVLGLLWLPLPDLLLLPFDAGDLRQLLDSDDANAHRLLRRLTASPVGVINEWIALIGPEAEAIRRDIILRLLADERMHHLPLLGQLIHESNDPEVLRSLLRMNDVKLSMPLLRILIQRLRMQAAGELAMDEGPLQHAICHAIFDSPYLSPTPLRELAVQLIDRVPSLAQMPIRRFLALHGEKRSPEQ